MIAGLQRFVVELRAAGLAVSPAEWIDALRALERIALSDAARFRIALRAALAKNRKQQALFDRVFEAYFVPPARERRPRRGVPAVGGLAGERPRGGPRRAGDGAVRPPARSSPEPPERPRPRAPADTAQPSPATAGRRGRRLRRVLLAHERTASRHDAARGARVLPPERRPLGRRLPVDEERELAALVPRIVARIRLRTGRRRARAARGALDLRRVFRENVRHGGAPWILPRRRPRPRRSRVVLLVDVSWSAATAAALFVAIAGALLQRSPRTRILFFVDRVADATSAVRGWIAAFRPQTAPVEFARLLAGLPGLDPGAPSDYGRAFHGLLGSAAWPLGRRTVLVVLGDGRTNRFDPQAFAFEELARRCGSVLWLVPEEAARWGSGDSALGAYLPHADLAVEAQDVAGLARGVGELVRRL